MPQVLLDEIVETGYGQFDLTWDYYGEFDGDWDRSFDGQTNGLVGAAHPGGVYLNLARRSGGSPIRIVLHDTEPADDPSYQDVVEVSITVSAGRGACWTSWAGGSGGTLEALGPGTYRLRVSARDRDAGSAGEFEDGIFDAYLLDLWPSDSGPDTILRTGSENARYWHREVGGRR